MITVHLDRKDAFAKSQSNSTVYMKANRVPTAARFLCTLCICILCAAAILSAWPTNGEEALYDRVIRLHVLANSDDEADQSQKLAVRDAVLTYLAEAAPNTRSAEDAEDAYQKLLPQLTKIAEESAAENGCAYPCRVTLTQESYPSRTYRENGETVTLPAGVYRSLRVQIGASAGQNWWCVLFLPLCLSLAAEYCTKDDDTVAVSASADPEPTTTTSEEKLLAAGFTPYEITLISGEESPKTVVKFRIVEFFRRLFSK